jgi:hypothetical protein
MHYKTGPFLVVLLPHQTLLTTHRWLPLVTPWESPGRVPNQEKRTSSARQLNEDPIIRPGDWESRSDYFGDCIKQKDSQVLRIGFQNIGGYPRERNKVKEEILRVGMTTWSFDIY